MNKVKRDDLFLIIAHRVPELTRSKVRDLRNYVDTLEAALVWYRDCCECEQVYGRQAREALDKGK